VKNGGTDTNWGIDGYTVYVMNRNINGDWHVIKDNVAATAGASTTQVVRVTTGMGSVTINGTTAGNMTLDMLRVMRDYKHYFQVRSYVLNGSAKVYSPLPAYTYTNSANGTGSAETDYVKWGARQITPEEFVKIATMALQLGLSQINGTDDSALGTSGWSTGNLSRKNGNGANTGRGGSGSISAWSSFGVGQWMFDISNYKPSNDTRANKGDANYKLTFVTVHTDSNMDGSDVERQGTLYADSTGAGRLPSWYGGIVYSNKYYGIRWCNVYGPSDTPGLYSGRFRFANQGYTGGQFSYTSGTMQALYPATSFSRDLDRTPSGAIEITGGGRDSTPLHFTAYHSWSNPNSIPYRQDRDEWY
jgi:hypothetical protein